MNQVRTVAAVPLDRAAVMVLGQLAEAGPVRPGELAARLGIEAPHAHPAGAAAAASPATPTACRTRTTAAPSFMQLTPAGRAASERIRDAGTTGMQAALAHSPPEERRPARHAAAPHGR